MFRHSTIVAVMVGAVLFFTCRPARAADPDRHQPLHGDIFVIGLVGGDPIAVNIQFLTMTWKRVQLVLIDFCVGGSYYNKTLNLTIGPTVGIGGHHGHRSKLSHWFITGPWYGEMYLEWFFAVHKYRGLFVPAGYEFRQRWGQKGRAVWGVRVFVAYSPVGGYVRRCSGSWLCSDPDAKVKQPLMGGVSVFIGR